jgi:predicted extracellular nuclease
VAIFLASLLATLWATLTAIGIPIAVSAWGNEWSSTDSAPPRDSPRIHEFVLNHAGADTSEFVEVVAAARADLRDLCLVQLDGDQRGGAAGRITSTHPLERADENGFWTTGLMAEVLENGSLSLLLVRSFTGKVGDDLDGDNDGRLDRQPWREIVDSVAVHDGDAGDRHYASLVLGPDFANGFTPGGASRFTPTAAAPNGWMRNDFDGEGLAGMSGTPEEGEAHNTPGAPNRAFMFGPRESVSIARIQGATHRSPLVGRKIETSGVVTAVSGSGFFLQSLEPDQDNATAEGVFVASGRPIPAKAGDRVSVSGIVHELAAKGELSVTRIGSPKVQVLGVATLPQPIKLGRGGRLPPSKTIDDDRLTTFQPDGDGIDFLESLEGMLVEVVEPLAVAATNRFGEMVVVVDGGRDAGPRTARGGVRVTDDDFNPERLIVDDLLVSRPPIVVVGDKMATFTGVVDYAFGNFRVLNLERLQWAARAAMTDADAVPPLSAPLSERGVGQSPSSRRLRIATFNVENLAATAPKAKMDAVARVIAIGLGGPDIVALQEIQDDNGEADDGVVSARETGRRLIAAIARLGGPVYEFTDLPPTNNTDGGAPGANIRCAFLHQPSRVQMESTRLTRLGVDDPVFADSRKPLIGEFTAFDRRLVVINCHFASKSPDDPLFGAAQPPGRPSEERRVSQAAAVRRRAAALAESNPQAGVIVLGDLNDFEFSAPLAALRENRLLENLMETIPASERYTYNFQGNSQTLDHFLVARGRFHAARATVFHRHADFPSAGRASDHDPVVAELEW